MNKLSKEKQAAVVRALVQGASVNSTVRMTRVAKTTILRLVRCLGNACANFHDEHVRGLQPQQIQCDEVWSFVGAKQKNVSGLPGGFLGLWGPVLW